MVIIKPSTVEFLLQTSTARNLGIFWPALLPSFSPFFTSVMIGASSSGSALVHQGNSAAKGDDISAFFCTCFPPPKKIGMNTYEFAIFFWHEHSFTGLFWCEKKDNYQDSDPYPFANFSMAMRYRTEMDRVMCASSP